MAVPQYAPPTRQKSEVLKTDQELEQMRRAEIDRMRQRRNDLREDWLRLNPRALESNIPSVAEFMQGTGANSQQAVDAIVNYRNSGNYMPEGGFQAINWDAPLTWHGNTGENFDYKFTEPTTAGQIVPVFQEFSPNGNTYLGINGFQAIAGTPGEVGGRIRATDKDTFYQDAMGYGAGTEALDSFARQMGATDWNSLDWSTIGRNGSALRDTSLDDFGGPYGLKGGGNTQYFNGGAEGTPWNMVPGSSSYLTDEQQSALAQFKGANQGFKGAEADANADFGRTMDQRMGNTIRNEQAYQSQLGGAFTGGVMDDRYSDPFFGQITGREAQASPFSSNAGQYPWSQPGQQLDISSLLQPAYGGPTGGGSMGAYGGFGGWGSLGGLGGQRQNQGNPWGGPFGAKSPWSPS